MKKMLRVDMTNLTAKLEDLPEEYSGLGGRGLTSTIINREVPPTCEPLSPHNKLVIAPGLLSGTGAPCSGRLSVGGKSPLTGGIKESNVGGTASEKLAHLGIAAIIVEGQPNNEAFSCLTITKDAYSLEHAGELVGLGNYAACERLHNKHGEKACIISIGQAGEMRLAGASVAVTDMEGLPNRYAGRGGMGAVMGSKGLKAIVIDDSGAHPRQPKDKEGFAKTARALSKGLREGKGFFEQLRTLGTPGGIPNFNAFGTLPTRNFAAGCYEHADKIQGAAIVALAKQRGAKMHGCTASCPIRCSITFHDKDHKFLVGGLEYETVAMLGSNLLVDDVDAIARMNRLLNDCGLDTIETGAALGVVMESGYIKFGDSESAIELIQEVAKGTIRGRMIGSGAVITGKLLGVKRVPAVKGQAIPAHHPQSNKIVGVTYCTSPMGADHTAGIMYDNTIHNPEGKVEKSRDMQIQMGYIDSLGMCMFSSRGLPGYNDYITALLTALHGTPYTEADLIALGKRVLRTEHEFNERAGFTQAHDRLPEFMTEVKIKPHDLVFDVPYEEVDKLQEGL
ncbi:MAG: aldehyde ferredoxin oxidoreductase [Candidatus Abyssobacteria bacterium SURF_17]|uniref:Aldehyde ferredoxin oxidoreductase n=1 Tax=Candidatus Abyssobacteria bacterium SURF_17 TaxID=2093361 RepID=A0A419EWY0_9BACT|nr:MAG: aldehyde ferredoxin oxidoreductase [Candidatus Abyssubacteria bacterium SURF_17]